MVNDSAYAPSFNNCPFCSKGNDTWWLKIRSSVKKSVENYKRKFARRTWLELTRTTYNGEKGIPMLSL